MEAERKERERLVKEEHDRIHQSMIRLIEERDRKLAERGIFTMEQQIEEIEKRSQELLAKVNEGRVNKIEKVEVYKADEFDDVVEETSQNEKTKGQEFAEHLKRQFAALDDEEISTEDLIAIQEYEGSNEYVQTKHNTCMLEDNKEENRDVQENTKLSKENNNADNDCEVEIKKAKLENSDHIKEQKNFSHEESVDSNSDSGDKCKSDNVISNLSEEKREISSTVCAEILDELFEKAIEVPILPTLHENECSNSITNDEPSNCKYYNDCLCLPSNDTLSKENDMIEVNIERDELSIEKNNQEETELPHNMDKRKDSEDKQDVKVTTNIDQGPTFLFTAPNDKKCIEGKLIDWENIFKVSDVKMSPTLTSDEDENMEEAKRVKSTEVKKIEDEKDSNEDILSRILNNPQSINPFVADMIVKYWNKRMDELRTEKPVIDNDKKKFNLRKEPELNIEKQTNKEVNGNSKRNNDEIETKSVSSSSSESSPERRPTSTFSIRNHILKSNSKLYQNKCKTIKENKPEFPVIKNNEISVDESTKSVYVEVNSHTDSNDQEESLKTYIFKKNVEEDKMSSKYTSNCSSLFPFKKTDYDNKGPSLMEEIQRMKTQEENDKNESTFNKDERLKELMAQYNFSSETKEYSSDEESNDEDPVEESKSFKMGFNFDIKARSRPVRAYNSSNAHNYEKIGEKLQCYDFDDQKTERLFGYNLPERFFFKEDRRNQGISHRNQKSICNDFGTTTMELSDPNKKYVSTGTSSKDLNSQPYNKPELKSFGQGETLPFNLFQNCPEIKGLIENDTFCSPSSSPQPRFEEIIDDEPDVEHITRDDALEANFSKYYSKVPSSVGEWKKLGSAIEEETDKKIKAIEKYVESIGLSDDEEEFEMLPKSKLNKRKNAWQEKDHRSFNSFSSGYEGKSSKLFPNNDTQEEFPAFLKLDIDFSKENKEEHEKDKDKKKVLIEELDLD